MNCRVYVSGLVAAFALGTGLYAAEGHAGHGHGKKGKRAALPVCPVMGEDPIDLSVSAATDDGPVFFCCKGCIKKFNTNPEKYSKKAEAQRKALAALSKVQTTCPVSGKPVVQKLFAEHEGQKVYFCCKTCLSKFQKTPEKYKSALANSFTYQTECPVMGEDINPEAFMELADGRKVFFCCKGCDKKLTKDAEKYLPNLKSQGIHVSAKQLASAKGKHEGHDHHEH